jgi:hypothetical protein
LRKGKHKGARQNAYDDGCQNKSGLAPQIFESSARLKENIGQSRRFRHLRRFCNYVGGWRRRRRLPIDWIWFLHNSLLRQKRFKLISEKINPKDAKRQAPAAGKILIFALNSSHLSGGAFAFYLYVRNLLLFT